MKLTTVAEEDTAVDSVDVAALAAIEAVESVESVENRMDKVIGQEAAEVVAVQAL